MDKDVQCQSCGSTWRIKVREGSDLVGNLQDCPLCSKTANEE